MTSRRRQKTLKQTTLTRDRIHGKDKNESWKGRKGHMGFIGCCRHPDIEKDPWPAYEQTHPRDTRYRPRSVSWVPRASPAMSTNMCGDTITRSEKMHLGLLLHGTKSSECPCRRPTWMCRHATKNPALVGPPKRSGLRRRPRKRRVLSLQGLVSRIRICDVTFACRPSNLLCRVSRFITPLMPFSSVWVG